MLIQPSTRIGPYQVMSLLGAGGMGEVYRARDPKLNRDVAIKVLPELFATDRDRLARFEREAQSLAALNHPNIAQVYGVIEDPPGLVMELVEGEDLSQRILRGPIPFAEALPIAKQIAEALEAAHERGIVHRDLKPANIKVRDDATVKVLDFGLAKAMDRSSVGQGFSPAEGDSPKGLDYERNSPTFTSPAMTQMGMILGTAAYMAPEQAKGRAVDKRADIWAFGCVVFEMLTAQRPFGGDDVTEMVASIVKDEPAWSVLPSNLPAPLVSLLHRCLVKDAKHRLRDIGDARLQLDEASVAPAIAVATAAARARSRLWPAAATVAAIAALAFAVPAVRHLREAPAERVAARFIVAAPENHVPIDAPVFSPDGRRIVFAATGRDATSKLWVQAIDSLSASQMAGTEGAHYPFWSPDSRFVGFFAGGKLKKVDLSGGLPQTLADAPTGRGGTWNADGVIVFEASNIAPLVRVSASGGTAVTVTTLDSAHGETSHRYPHFLPGGRHFLYYALAIRPEKSAIYVGTLGSDEKVRLIEGATGEARYASGFLLYPRRSTLMAQPFDAERRALGAGDASPVAEDVQEGSNTGSLAFSVSPDGMLAYRAGALRSENYLRWFDRTGKMTGQIGGADSYSTPRLAPDGRSLAVTIRDQSENFDIWIVEFARELKRRLTFDAAGESLPVWSPDGAAIVYHSEVNGPAGNIYRVASNGSGRPEAVLKLPTPTYPMTWSPDGQSVLYVMAGPKGSTEVWSQRLAGNQQPSAYLEAGNPTQATFSPDGRFVTYTSDETGRSEIFLQSFPARGAKVQVSTSGGLQPRWRKDGRELFYVSLDQKLTAVDVRLDAVPEIGKPSPLFDVRLGTTSFSFYAPEYDVSSDGQRFLINVAGRSEASPITVVLNWPSMLKPQQ